MINESNSSSFTLSNNCTSPIPSSSSPNTISPTLPTNFTNSPYNITHTPPLPSIPNPIITPPTYKNLITISTLNVRGLNQKEKLRALADNITSERAVFCCSETKCTESNPLPRKIKDKTIISSKPSTSASNGACIITTRPITNHIFNTFSTDEFWCAIHLKFKPKANIIIISCYLPHDPNLRKRATKSLREFIRAQSKFHIIIAGDFNSYPKSSPSINAPSPAFKRNIYRYLHNFVDTAKVTNKETQYTHITPTSASRIDQIWITKDLASKILSYKITDQTAIPADHKQLTTILDWFEYKPERISFTTKAFQFHKATKEQIQGMQEDIELTCATLNNPSWETLNTIIKKAMEANIPRREQTKSSRPTHKFDKISLAIKSIKKAVHNFKHNNPSQNLTPLAANTLKKISSSPYSLKSFRKAQRILTHERMVKLRDRILLELQEGVKQNYQRFWSKPKSALRRALGDLKPSLDLSILSDNDQLIEDPDQLSDIIINHFKEILKEKPFVINSEWTEHYLPLSHPSEIFNSATMNITIEETKEALNDLPRQKAPGLSCIPYEAWSNLGKCALSHIINLFNQTLNSSQAPLHWKQSAITLLPKKIVWSHNLSDTRPISLIESSRKIFTKILNNRIGSIILNHNILSNFNFAGLKNQSTMEPISIIQSEMETAANLNKQLWAVSFDISKAYDSVNLTSLEAAMARIKLPSQLTHLILDLLHNREIKIITHYNLTNFLKVNNGLDQGETLAPLLWTIFYDPLVSRIANHSTIKSTILAYMDDVALLSHSIQHLQDATNIFCSFLALNSINCNKDKTDLITNLTSHNSSRSQPLLVENQHIQAKPYKESIKYLGVYLSGSSSSRSSKAKLKEKITKFSAAIAAQKAWNGTITKQASHWIIPAQLDYATQISIMSNNEIFNIQAIMSKAIKSKLGIERTISNKITHSQAGLNIIDLHNRRDLTAIKLLIAKLANRKTFPYLKKEILSIQAAHAIWCCPICNPHHFKDSWLILAAHLARKYNIKVCPNPCPFNNLNHEYSIGLLSKITKPSALLISNSNIKTLQDLLIFNSPVKLTWSELHTHRGFIARGRVPPWFTSIQSTNNILKGRSLPVPNKSPRFWAFLINNTINFIKVRVNAISSEQITGPHYLVNQSKQLISCNCNIQPCTITKNITDLKSTWTSKILNTYSLLNNLDELKAMFFPNLPPLPQITITPPSIPNSAPISIEITQTKDFLHVHTPSSLHTYNLTPNSWIHFWPILTQTLIKAPHNSNIKISLFSIPKQSTPNYINRKIKVPSCRFIDEINQLISTKNLTLSWHKIKANTNINFGSLTVPTPTPIPQLFPLTYGPSPLINNTHATSVTHWIKFVNYYTNLFNILLSRSTTLNPQTLEDLEVIINSNKKLKKSDQYKFRDLATFRVKLLTDQLPTRVKLHKRYPSLYPDNTCPRCDAWPETTQHIFTCLHATTYINKKKGKFISTIDSLPSTSTLISNFNLTGLTLIDLASGTFHSPFNKIKKKEDIMNKALKILYKIWKQRSATANTSSFSGIKWKKTKAEDSSLPQKSNTTFQSILNILEVSNNHTNKSIFSPAIISSF